MIHGFERVLVTTDLSPLGDRAVSFAFGAVDPGGKVYLLHVVEPVHVPSPLYAHYSPGRTPTLEEKRRQEDELAAKMRALVPPESQARGVVAEVLVVESDDVAPAIVEAAERLDVQAICLATHGRTGISKALFGSVAEEVVRSTGRAVLLIPPPRA